MNRPLAKLKEPIVEPADSWKELETSCHQALSHGRGEGWRYLTDAGEIRICEKDLLRHTGKAQDGLIAKFLNRPISRSVTRRLLKFPIEPRTLTLSILALPFIAFLFLIRGDYAGFVVGTALFQIYNILDGCDGEIARAKYLDSERGRRLDAFCDFAANLIFVLCLGIGLFRQPSVSANIRFVYLLESFITFCIMAGGLERFLMPLLARDDKRVASRRQEDFNMAERFFGRALIAFIYQITQRDVIYFVFLLLAIVGRASWILHIFFAFSVITLLFRLFRKSWRQAAET